MAGKQDKERDFFSEDADGAFHGAGFRTPLIYSVFFRPACTNEQSALPDY